MGDANPGPRRLHPHPFARYVQRLGRRTHVTEPAADPGQQPPAVAAAAPIPGAAPLLGRIDPVTAPVHPLIIAAAVRHSQTVSDPHARLAWTRYAHLGSYQLHGPYDPVTRHATLLYALALGEHGRVLDAYRLHRHRLAVAQLLGQPEELLAAHRHHAEARHAISQCELAATEIEQSLIWWHGHRSPPGEGTRLLCSYAVILAGCGQNRAALHAVRTHPDLLPDSDAGLADLARRLATVQHTHAPICRRHPTRRPPQTTTAQRHTDWSDILRNLPLPPADPRRLGIRRDATDHP